MSINERLKCAREARGLTQKDLADKAGLNPKSIYLIENELQDPKVKTVEKIMAALDILSFTELERF